MKTLVNKGKICSKIEDSVLIITIDNQRRRNAMTVAMWDRLRAIVTKQAQIEGVGCIVIEGAGPDAFCAGADIDEFENERSNRVEVTRFHEDHIGPTLQAIIECGIPTIAKIQGKCFGGGLEIAACCDIRIGTDSTQLGAPVTHLGFPLAFGETEIIVRIFGFPVAAELLLEGRILTAEDALARGVITRLVPAENLDEEVRTTAARITAGSPYATRRMKEQFTRLLSDSSPVSKAERNSFYDFAETYDYNEGYRAFLGKRKPKFLGR